MFSLLCEMKCDAEGVVTSSSGMLVVNGTSSERASDNDTVIDYETGWSAQGPVEMRWGLTKLL